MIWNRYNWSSDIALPLLMAVLRTIWLVPWLELIRRALSSNSPAPLLPMQILLVVYLISLAMTRWLLPLESLNQTRFLHIFSFSVVLFLVIWWRFYGDRYAPWDGQWLSALWVHLRIWENEFPGVYFAGPAVFYLWFQGIFDGRSKLYREDVWGAFSFGFLALALAAIVAVTGERAVLEGMGPLVLVFFACGMAALAVSSIEAERQAVARRGEPALSPNRYWLASIAAVIGALLVVGLILSAVLTPEIVARALRWTDDILGILGQILYYLLLIVAYLIFLLLGPLFDLLQRMLGGATQPEPLRMPDFQQQFEDIERGAATIPPIVGRILSVSAAAIVVLIIIAAFVVVLRRMQSGRDDTINETRESILSHDLLADQLGQLWRGLLGRLRRPRAPGEVFLSLEGEQPLRRVVRATYQSLLAVARQRGAPRQRSQTPAEYQHTLTGLAADTEDIAILTRGYVKARYAPDPPTSEEADGVRAAWARFLARLRAADDQPDD